MKLSDKKLYIILGVCGVIILAAVFGYSYLIDRKYKSAQNPVLITKVDPNSLPPEYLKRYSYKAAVLDYAAENFLNDSRLQSKKTEQELSNEFKIWFKLGMVRKLLNDYKGAEQAWLEATKIAPENSAPFANLADLYTFFLRDYKKAEELYIKTLTIFPTVDGYRSFADFYRISAPDSPNKVEDVILQGLKVFPDRPDLLGYLGSYFKEIGRKEKAIEYYEKLIAVSPDHPGARADLDKLKSN